MESDNSYPRVKALMKKPAVRRGGVMMLVAILAAAVYSPARNMPFVFDDVDVILRNPYLHARSLLTVVSENPFRAVANLALALELRAFCPAYAEVLPLGEAQPHLKKGYTFYNTRLQPFYVVPGTRRGWPVEVDYELGLVFPVAPVLPLRAFNFALHLLNAVLLYLILRRLSIPETAALGSFILFCIHPLATESVNYITAVYDLLALTFCLAALLAHLKADDRRGWEYLAGLLYVMGLFCKETAAPLPLIAFLIDYGRGRPGPRVLWGLILTGLYVLARSRWYIFLDSSQAKSLGIMRYLLLQQYVYWLYLCKLLIPTHLNFDYDVSLSLSRDLFFLALNIALAGLVLWGFFRGRYLFGRRSPGQGIERGEREKMPFSGAAFFLLGMVAISPTSSVIPLGETMREIRAYPLLAIFAGAAPLLIMRFFSGLTGRRRIAGRTCFVALLLLFTLAAWSRNLAWYSDLTLYRDTMKKSPAKTRVMFNYALALLWFQKDEQSLFWNKRVLAQDPAHGKAKHYIEYIEKEEQKTTGQ